MARTNWAGNVSFRAARLHRPTSTAALQRLVAGSDRLRVLGTGHSFSALADTTGDQVSLAAMPWHCELGAGRSRVTVAGHLRYGELGPWLQDRGLALRNLGSLPHISVAGACATATHGAGDRLGNLATAVSALEMVSAGGDLVAVDRATPGFAGHVVALGALGVVTRVTLDVVPSYDVAQWVWEDLPMQPLLRTDGPLDELFARADGVSLFTRWQRPVLDRVWLKQRLVAGRGAGGPDLADLGATRAAGPRHPVAGQSPAACTPQLGRPGPWHERLPHFRADHAPSLHGAELQSEYVVARAAGPGAMAAVARLGPLLDPVLAVSEIRTMAADDLWLSPSYQRDSLGLHFTWHPDAGAVTRVLPVLEERLAPFEPRPHWGKLFAVDPAGLKDRYARWPDFLALRRRWDPGGMFRNELLDRWWGEG